MRSAIMIVILTSMTCWANAQTFEKISFTLQSEAIGFPFTNYAPLHPGAEVGLTVREKYHARSISTFNVYLGGYYHEKLATGVYLRAEYQHTFKLGNKFGLIVPMGLGYLHTFYPADLYDRNENGDFERVSHGGRPHALINLGIGLSYLGSDRFEPFIKQELAIETPFANTFPFIPHSFIKAGIAINLN